MTSRQLPAAVALPISPSPTDDDLQRGVPPQRESDNNRQVPKEVFKERQPRAAVARPISPSPTDDDLQRGVHRNENPIIIVKSLKKYPENAVTAVNQLLKLYTISSGLKMILRSSTVEINSIVYFSIRAAGLLVIPKNLSIVKFTKIIYVEGTLTTGI